ncbi:hypothetical protein J3R83DRAFT_2257 [Lanmaoa asiatica]|nr:hypothetical protein J3R83DRAFT_8818 [Lanmaoa asiatica]KAH0828870.1 hypothetical protein J3R83DRAFT_2257 [Lanmaoa asiatica]
MAPPSTTKSSPTSPNDRSIPRFYRNCDEQSYHSARIVLEQLWNRLEAKLLQPGISINQYAVEIAAMFERVLNFAHTGNAKVLIRTLMDRSWLSLGCIADGLPCISDNFTVHQPLDSKEFQLVTDKWPIGGETRRPLIASKRVQQLTYGQKHYDVRSSLLLSILLIYAS